MAPAQPTSSLPSSHPLIAELTSLRQQLAQYQKSGHQSGIQLQGARLECSLAKEETALLRETNDTLRSEITVLRTHPLPPTQPPTSTALAELTLAHRRLSTKLDLTEQALQSSQLELASCKQEISRLGKEREGDRAIINELRRGEEEREEEIAWERGERRKAEELKRLCDLAIDEYKDLVRSLDPRAIPPSSPQNIVIDPPTSPQNIVIDPPTDLDSGSDAESTPETASASSSPSSLLASAPAPVSASDPVSASTSLSAPESISNLLVGQRGVSRLFEDFTQTLAARDKEIHRLKDRLEELEHTLSTVTDQLDSETSLRVTCESQRDTILRDDASAAKVVERYMTFTQKTHATVHLHLDNLRARSAATQLSLRKELANTQRKLVGETERAERLRMALDEASENLSREVGGRRREVGLRLKMISNEEKRERRIESWLDRVRRQREGVEGAVLEADILESLLDEGIEAYTIDTHGRPTGNGSHVGVGGPSLATKDKQRSWRGMLGRKRGNSTATDQSDGGEAGSIARVLLAEELVDTLVKDLQVETERRMALESQRVEWLAREAVEGREAEEVGVEGQGDEDGVMFDLDQHEHEDDVGNIPKADGEKGEEEEHIDGGGKSEPMAGAKETLLDMDTPEPDPILGLPLETPSSLIPLETPPPLEPTPNTTLLHKIFQPLHETHSPLQQSLHSLSHSLSDLRNSLPAPSKRPTLRKNPLADPVLLSILENLHESLEDARVDVEIAIADEDRVYRGFEALLGVGVGMGGGGGGVVQSKDVFEDARRFVEFKLGAEGWGKLKVKVEDLEMDLTSIKSKIHELEGMDLASVEDDEPESPSLGMGMGRTSNPSSPNPNPNPNINSESTSILKPRPSIWHSVSLRTISPSPISTPLEDGPSGRKRLGLGGGMFGGVSSVGRSLSASVISAPRKVGGFAGGLYKPKKKDVQSFGKGEEEEEGLMRRKEDDDVE